MSGPKYVKDFTFPKDFGFTGSAGQVHVRPHTRQRYAHGGRVSKPAPMPPPESRRIKPAPLPPPQSGPKPKRIGKAKGGKVGRRPPLKPSPEQVLGGTIAAGAAAAAYDKLRRREERPVQPPPDERRRSTVDAARGSIRRQREQDLGLKKGGEVHRMPNGKMMKGRMKNC